MFCLLSVSSFLRAYFLFSFRNCNSQTFVFLCFSFFLGGSEWFCLWYVRMGSQGLLIKSVWWQRVSRICKTQRSKICRREKLRSDAQTLEQLYQLPSPFPSLRRRSFELGQSFIERLYDMSCETADKECQWNIPSTGLMLGGRWFITDVSGAQNSDTISLTRNSLSEQK